MLPARDGTSHCQAIRHDWHCKRIGGHFHRTDTSITPYERWIVLASRDKKHLSWKTTTRVPRLLSGYQAASMKSCSRPSTTRQYRHLRRRNAGAYEEEDRCLLWSPWSRWRVVLMLLYAVIVPAVIIYLLDRFDRLQSPDRVVASRPAWTLRPRAHEQSSLDTKTLWRAKRTLLPHHHHERQQQQTFESVMVKHTAYDSFLLLGDSITQVRMQSGDKMALGYSPFV